MSLHSLAGALERAKTVLQRRPDLGLHEDAPATARWLAGTRVVSRHANGTEIATDMPGELGGSGDQVTAGWLFRAGLAACAATSIAMRAASEGVALTMLEVRASSRSDARGLLGITGADGTPVYAGPDAMQLQVQIAADGVAAERLRALVDDAVRGSPIPNAVQRATALDLQIRID
jgi:organic hydroperoxide reductase OsmC/OhrA